MLRNGWTSGGIREDDIRVSSQVSRRFRMSELDKKAMVFLREFLKVGMTRFEIYPEVNLSHYKITVSKLNKKQVRDLKDAGYI